jgi:hypothetical protein
MATKKSVRKEWQLVAVKHNTRNVFACTMEILLVVRLQLKLTIKIEVKRISCSKHDLKLTQESSLIKLTQTEYETYKEFLHYCAY